MGSSSPSCFCGWSRADVSGNGHPDRWERSLYQEVKTTDFSGTCLLKRCQRLLLLDDSLSAVDAKTEQAIIDARFKRNEKTRRPLLFLIACLLFIRRIGSRLGSGQIVEEGKLVIYWLKKAGIMNNTNGNKNRKENKMKVLKRLLSRITLIQLSFLAGFICLLLATIFLNCHPFFSKRWSMGLWPHWPTVAGKVTLLQRWEDFISWSWAWGTWLAIHGKSDLATWK